ncbi:MAG: outer-membrane lipoprotein carrier protein LolA [Comamonadaceae bacterium]|nr:outer-membrane lipoprotein carrier protein LolA [Comamonadaceae bacterium]
MPVAVGAGRGVEQLRAFLDGTPRRRKPSSSRPWRASRAASRRRRAEPWCSPRPGKFRWTYDKPYYQLIVGDGEKLWVYDKDLNQVTVKKLGQALGATSRRAARRATTTWERNFVLKDAGRSEGLDMVEATPQGRGRHLRAGAHRLVRQPAAAHGTARQLRPDDDAAASASSSAIRSVDADQFRFTPPKGADVVGE